jgi:hypothetical protein
MACPVAHVSKLFKEPSISNDGYTSELQSIVSDLPFQMSFTILAYQDEEFLVSIFPAVKYWWQAFKCDQIVVLGLG